MKRHPNVVWLVLWKTRRARKWNVESYSTHLSAARRTLAHQVAVCPGVDHRLHRVVIPESDVLWIARKK